MKTTIASKYEPVIEPKIVELLAAITIIGISGIIRSETAYRDIPMLGGNLKENSLFRTPKHPGALP